MSKIIKSKSGKITKTSDDLGIVGGWASIMTIGGVLVEDDDGDVIFTEDIEKAARDFVIHYRDQGDTHQYTGVGTLTQSLVFTNELQKALEIDLGFEGWYVEFQVDKANHPEVWEKIKKGEYAMFSIGGTGEWEDYDGETYKN